MTQTAIPHFFAIGIEPADIDFMGHVNNASYLKWVQAAVISHWQRFAPAEALPTHLWVALKHEITYRRPAFLEDVVVASVFLEKIQGARAFYETVIKRGEVVLAEVKSSWCCLNAETRRPARLAASIIDLFFQDAEAAVPPGQADAVPVPANTPVKADPVQADAARNDAPSAAAAPAAAN